jgi:beta-phosphoglucomutase-like phosphatase (HAD superfamily)
VEVSKPAPDIFLLAAKELGLSPDECLVAEDSRNGVIAGSRAGMKVAMIPDFQPFSEDLRPSVTYLLSSLKELPDKLI